MFDWDPTPRKAPRRLGGAALAASKPGPKASAPKVSVATKKSCTTLKATLKANSLRIPCPAAVRVGYACSGWNSELFALENLQVKTSHLFSCDKEPACKKLGLSLHAPARWFDDVTDDSFRQAPTVDCFFAGFPCQSWSTAGKGQGFLDEEGRGIIVFFLIRYVRERLPATFLFENVAGLLKNHPDKLLHILRLLNDVTDNNGEQATPSAGSC